MTKTGGKICLASKKKRTEMRGELQTRETILLFRRATVSGVRISMHSQATGTRNVFPPSDLLEGVQGCFERLRDVPWKLCLGVGLELVHRPMPPPAGIVVLSHISACLDNLEHREFAGFCFLAKVISRVEEDYTDIQY